MQNNTFSSDKIGKTNNSNRLNIISSIDIPKKTNKIKKIISLFKRAFFIVKNKFIYFFKNIFSIKKTRIIFFLILFFAIAIFTTAIIVFSLLNKRNGNSSISPHNHTEYSIADYKKIEDKSIDESGDLNSEKMLELVNKRIDVLNQSKDYRGAMYLAIEMSEKLQRDMAFISAEEMMSKIDFNDIHDIQDKIYYCDRIISIYRARGKFKEAERWVNIRSQVSNLGSEKD